MTIEKIKDNKFKILISLLDLKKENIDIHEFMSYDFENQEILKRILSKLKKDYNILLDTSNILINAFYIKDKDFIIIISNNDENYKQSRVCVSRQKISTNDINIYRFDSTDELYEFFKFIKNISNLKYSTLINCPVYEYNHLLFLVMHENGISDVLFDSIDKYLSEFTFKVNKANNFYIKLIEFGTQKKILI